MSLNIDKNNNQKEVTKKFETTLRKKLKSWNDYLDTCEDQLLDIPNSFFNHNVDTLEFPASLNSKLRKVVHSVALDLDIYHSSVGDGENRHIVLSRKPIDVLISSPSPHRWYNINIPKISLRPAYFNFEGHRVGLLQHLVDCVALPNLSFDIDLNAPFDLKSDKWDNYSIKVVDKLEELISTSNNLLRQKVISFDCEMHNFRSYFGITCSIQISDSTDIFIIDCLSLWDHISVYLGPIFASPDIVKVGHALRGMDVPCLFKDFGIVVVNGFDTQIAAKILGLHLQAEPNEFHQAEEIPMPSWEVSNCSTQDEGNYDKQKLAPASSMSLEGLLKFFRCPTIYQISSGKATMKGFDWRTRPFTSDMINYCSNDVRYLIPLYRTMSLHLLAQARGPMGDGITLLRSFMSGASMGEEGWVGGEDQDQDEEEEESTVRV